ncbi:hypothetical protein [Parafrankia discariae]|uniref:hypothetical protein n=1 Tax=Parafrankia discariae TaxID=365528 RepID=UPI00037AD49F|nr:hypothetical protein [Parafrankia discariae]
MALRVTASQRIGPLRIRRARGGAVTVALKIGPFTWSTSPRRHTRPRLTAAQRRALATRSARRAVLVRALLADVLAAALIWSAVRGAPGVVLVVLALAAIASWRRRRRALPTPTESEED